MFGGKKKKNIDVPTSFVQSEVITAPKIISKDNSQPAASMTIIARDTEIIGDIKLSGNLEVEGKVVGNISAKDGSSKPNLRVLETGSIEGDISVGHANINGCIKGNVQADSVDLAAKAKIIGDVHYKALEMTKGAQVNGSLVFDQQAQLGIEKQAALESDKNKADKPAEKSNSKPETAQSKKS